MKIKAKQINLKMRYNETQERNTKRNKAAALHE